MDNDDKKQPKQTGDPLKLPAEDVETLKRLALEMTPGSPESLRAGLRMDAEKRKLELRLNERQVVALETIAGAASALLSTTEIIVDAASVFLSIVKSVTEDRSKITTEKDLFAMILERIEEEIAKRDAATAAK